MQITEEREFYRTQVIVSAPTVNQDNINIEFNGLTLYSEDEDELISINNRKTIFEVERCSEGIKIDIFILNEGNDLKSRIDYLIDEDYGIHNFFIKVINKNTKRVLETRLNTLIGEQVTKSVPIELDEDTKESVDYVLDSLTEGNLSLNKIIYETISQNNNLKKFILSVKGITL